MSGRRPLLAFSCCFQCLFSCGSLLLSKQVVQSLQMPVKRSTSQWASATFDDSSSGGNDQFIISPHSKGATRKQSHGGEGSSIHANEEAERITEGHDVAAARGAKASDIIQKVEHPLNLDFEYTLRRVDRHHPQRVIDFTRGENQSMINRNEHPYEWTTELHDHRF
jgi:hypothetical protein